MITYEELYEYLRKEKFGERLQNLPKNFIEEYVDYVETKRKQFALMEGDMFADDLLREKKQYENAMTLFRDLILRRKKKILELVFVAAETGIMKKDFADMLTYEKELFEKLVAALETGDKSLQEQLRGDTGAPTATTALIMLEEDVTEFVDMQGNAIGPFTKGAVANIDRSVADILVADGKARHVDEKG